MNKLLLAAVASTAALSSGAFAQSSTTTDTFVVSATVTPTCVMENVQDIAIGALKINTTAGTNALLFGNGSSSQTSNPVYLSCNDTNSMTLSSSGPLVNTGNVPTAEEIADGFANEVDFRVYVNNYGAGTGNARRRFHTVNNGQYNAGPRHAMHRQVSFVGSVDYDDNRGFRPIAGDYSSTVTVTVAIAA
jgi:hypothetical protein